MLLQEPRVPLQRAQQVAQQAAQQPQRPQQPGSLPSTAASRACPPMPLPPLLPPKPLQPQPGLQQTQHPASCRAAAASLRHQARLLLDRLVRALWAPLSPSWQHLERLLALWGQRLRRWS